MKIIKIPFSGNNPNNKDCDKAPDEIARQLEDIYSSQDNHLVHPKLFKIESIPVKNKDWELTKRNIIESIMQNDDFPICIGGDHSLTYPLFKAFSQKFKNAGLIVFDAHPDTYLGDDYLYEHGIYLRNLVEENILNPKNAIVIGIRNPDPEEIDYMKRKGINFYTMKQIFENDIKEVCDMVMEKARTFGNMYISIDIDVLDPAFAPGTGCIEPGGISSRELIYFIQRLKLLKNLRMIDIVEVNPKVDFNNMTSKIAAKIIGEFF